MANSEKPTIQQALLAAMAKSMAAVIPDGLQREVIEDALQTHLFCGTNGDHSPFSRALQNEVYKVAEKMLAEPKYQLKIRDVMEQAFKQVLEDGSIVKRMASKISDTMRW